MVQLNCNGLRGKIDELAGFMHDSGILVAALQETKLTKRSNLATKDNFSILRCDRDRDKGGDLAFVVHNSVSFRPLRLPLGPTLDPFIERQAIVIKFGHSEVTLINVYIPPQSSCEPGYRPSIEHLLDIPDSIIMGDLNAHHDLWFSRLDGDTRDELLAEEIDASQHGVTAHTLSSPDVTIAHESLLPSLKWQTKIALGSDHVSIVIDLEYSASVSLRSDNRVFVNLNKTDWERFTDLTESKYLPIPLEGIKHK